MKFLRFFLFLSKYLPKYKTVSWLFLEFLSVAIVIFLNLIFGWLTEAVVQLDWKIFSLLCYLFVGLGLLSIVVKFGVFYFSTTFLNDIEQELRSRILDYFFKYEDPYKVITEDKGKYLPWCVEEVKLMVGVFSSYVRLFVSVFSFLLTLSILGSFNWMILMFVFAFLFLSYLPPLLLENQFKRLNDILVTLSRKHHQKASGLFKGLRLFLYAKKTVVFIRLLLENSGALFKENTKIIIKQTLLSSALYFWSSLLVIIFDITVALMAYWKVVPISIFVVSSLYMQTVVSNFNDASSAFYDILGKNHLLDRLFFITKAATKTHKDNFVNNLDSLESITFKNFSFKYERGKEVFSNFNLKLEKGKKYALIGASGIGKTTFSHVICGLLKDFDGSLVWNNIPYTTIDRDALLDKIFVLREKSTIFDGTVAENITMFSSDFNEQKITELLRVVGLPQLGIHDVVSKNTISKGQAQRINLARALFANREILIMDEALTGLPMADRKKLEHFLILLENITIVNITHNLTNKIEYNTIIDLDKWERNNE